MMSYFLRWSAFFSLLCLCPWDIDVLYRDLIDKLREQTDTVRAEQSTDNK